MPIHNRLGVAVLSATLAAFASSAFAPVVMATETVANAAKSERTPTPSELARSELGGYLAGQFAHRQRDVVAAAAFFRAALKQDPDNQIVLRPAFVMEAELGNWDAALPLAQRVVSTDTNEPLERFSYRLARMSLGVDAFKKGDLDAADKYFEEASLDSITELAGTIARAWVRAARKDAKGAYEFLDRLQNTRFGNVYRAYHRALISDVLGDTKGAGLAYDDALKVGGGGLRLYLAYAHHAVVRGDLNFARNLISRASRGRGAPHPLAHEFLLDLRAGRSMQHLVTSPEAGVAEVFQGIGEMLASERVADFGVDIGTIFLQLALHLKPEFQLAKIGLAAAYENFRQYQQAVDIYREVETQSSLGFTIALRKVAVMERMNETEKAAEVLIGVRDELSQRVNAARAQGEQNPLSVRQIQTLLFEMGYYNGPIDGNEGPATRKAVRDFQTDQQLEVDGLVGAVTRETLATVSGQDEIAVLRRRLVQVNAALGNLYRGREKFADAVEHYSRAIELLTNPQANDWTYFFYRGASYERIKAWPKAEADLKRALELDKDQPSVLNYLGYSWVDQDLNLQDAIAMIKRAVELRPDDGYIVDSLGWAYYRLKDYPAAVTNLEKAAALRPEDPTINDHLGDAYWRVGREREARFQWRYALSLGPDEENKPLIEAKLRDGLDGDAGTVAEDKRRANTQAPAKIQ